MFLPKKPENPEEPKNTQPEPELDEDLRPQDKVEAYRFERLRASGLDDVLALRLAMDRTVDLHQVIDAVKSGCTPAQVVRIFC